MPPSRGARALDSTAAAVAALLVVVLLLFRDAVFQGRVFYERDIQLAWLPQISSVIHAVARGSWPLWDAFHGFGQPLLADPSAQLLYPPTWLNLFVMPSTYYTVFVIGHILLGSAGVYALSRRLGTTGPGAFVAAVLWMLAGPTLSFVNLYHHLAGAAWIPWVVVASDGALRSGRARDTVRLAFVLAAQLLAGSAEMVTAAAVVAGLRALLSIVDWHAPRSAVNGRVLRSAALAGVLAIALAAAQWLPTVDVVRRSQRQSLDENERTVWSIHPVAALEAVLPVSLARLPLRADRRLALFEGREPFLSSIYLGLPAIALVAAATARDRRLPWLTGLAALLVALGRHTPVHALATAIVPVLGSFRYPSKAMVLVALGWTLLAGMGFDALRQAPTGQTPQRRPAMALVAVALVALLALAFLWLAPERIGAFLLHQPDPFGRPLPEILRAPRQDLLVALVCSGIVAILLILRRLRPSSASSTAVLVALVAAAELAWAHRGQNPTAPRELLTRRPAVLEPIRQEDSRRLYVYEYAGFEGKAAQHLGRLSPYILARVPAGGTRAIAQAFALREYPVPPQAAIWGLYGSFELDVRRLYPPYLADLAGFIRVTEGSAEHLRLLRVGAVSHVIALHSRGFEDLEPVRTFGTLFAEPARLFRVPGALPRAYAVGGSRVADGRFALERVLVDPDFDPEREVILAEGSPRSSPAGFDGKVRITDLRPDRLRLETHLSHDGWVVTVDGHGPGWKATLDGRPVPLLRANHAFRAVRTPAGRHVIEQIYRPRSAIAGAIISLCALAVAGITLVVTRARPAASGR